MLSITQGTSSDPRAGAVGNREALLGQASRHRESPRAQAQGYTPITYVLKLAAEDVGKEATKPRVVILVSDGKETCEGDPCATLAIAAAIPSSGAIADPRSRSRPGLRGAIISP